MGFGHRVYRAEDPRSRILKQTAQELGSPQVDVAEQLEQAALAALQQRHPERALATNVEYYSAIVLDVAEIPPPLAPAMFACSRVAGWSAHILEQKRTGRLFRPSAVYIGPAARTPGRALSTLAEAAVQADAFADRGNERELSAAARALRRRARGRRAFDRLPATGRRVSGDRPVPVSREDRAAPPRARRRQPCRPRLRAARARAPLARPSRRRQRRAAAVARARRQRRQRSRATVGGGCDPERFCASRHDPDPDQPVEDDEQPRELRQAGGEGRAGAAPQVAARLVSPAARVRVGFEVDGPAPAIGDVRVQLGGREVGMPEHLLHRA